MRILNMLLSLSVLTAIVGCGTPPTPATSNPGASRPTSTATTHPSPTPTTPKSSPAFSVKAEDYIDEWRNKDSKAAAVKYNNATVELEGTVTEVGQIGKPYVCFANKAGATGVYCFTVDREPWAKVVPGQKIKVKGKQSEGTCQLEKCQFVDPPPIDAIPIQATDLAADYAKDRAATIEKYLDKYLILTGEVTAIHPQDLYTAVELKGDGNVKVKFDLRLGSDIKKVAIGKPVKLIARLGMKERLEDKTILLRGAWLISGDGK
jgi:hypothetical protein